MVVPIARCDDACTNSERTVDGAGSRMMTMSNYKAMAVAGVLALGAAGTALAHNDDRSPSRELAGTWLVQVQLRVCATQAPLGGPFYSLLAFTKSGTLTGTTSGPQFAPGQRTGDYGVWRHSSQRTFSAVTEAFILADSTATPPGLKRGMQRISQTITLQKDDANKFGSVAKVEFFDTNSVLLISGCATATGQRFE
jgi:hypothetical protein